MAQTGPLILDVDLTAFWHEFERMIRGEIAYHPGYLAELVNVTDQAGRVFPLADFRLVCEACGQALHVVPCPECQTAPAPTCALCEGYGGWLACAPCEALSS